MPMPKQPRVPTPWAVHCRTHGLVYLTEAEYTFQMNRPDSTWRCPCGDDATWDDEIYEAHLDALDAAEAGKVE